MENIKKTKTKHRKVAKNVSLEYGTSHLQIAYKKCLSKVPEIKINCQQALNCYMEVKILLQNSCDIELGRSNPFNILLVEKRKKQP